MNREATAADFDAFPVGLAAPPVEVLGEHVGIPNPLPGASGTFMAFGPDARGASGWIHVARASLLGVASSVRCHQAVEAWLRCPSPTSGQAYIGLHASTGPGGAGAPMGVSHHPYGYWLGLGRAFAGAADPVPVDPNRVPLVLRFCDGAGSGVYGRQLELLEDHPPDEWLRVRLELMQLRSGNHLLVVHRGVVGESLTRVRDVEVKSDDPSRFRSGAVRSPAWALAGRVRDRRAVSMIHDLKWEAASVSG